MAGDLSSFYGAELDYVLSFSGFCLLWRACFGWDVMRERYFYFMMRFKVSSQK